MKISSFIYAIRIKTLLLSISGVLMAGFLSIKDHCFSIKIFIFSLFTSILYQILSNLANDLGDGIKGIDNKNSIGPQRALQSGLLKKKELKIAIIVTSIFSFISTILLLYISLIPNYWNYFFIFITLGIFSMISAISYSLGRKPYSHLGLGDLFVFIFFGLIQVLGNYFLYSKIWNWWIIFPATSIGCLSTAVLNLNNMRDIENDKKSGKNTFAVRIGLKSAKIYEIILLNLPFFLTLIYIIKKCEHDNYENFLFLMLFFIIQPINKKILYIIDPIKFHQYIYQIILLTLIFVILFGLSLIIKII